MRHRTAGDIEPLTATLGMTPALVVNTLRVVSEKQVVTPGFVINAFIGSGDVRLAAEGEFCFIPWATMWAGDLFSAHIRRILNALATSRARALNGNQNAHGQNLHLLTANGLPNMQYRSPAGGFST